MQIIFDTIFSSLIISTIVMICLIFTFVILSFYKPFKKNFYNQIFKVLMFMIAFMVMFLPAMFQASTWGFGYVRSFKHLLCTNDKLCFFDVIISGDDAGPDIEYTRMHIVDPKSGKRVKRTVIGENMIPQFYIDNKLFYGSYYRLFVYDLNTFQIEKKFSKETLPELYKEFSTGVDNFSYLQNEKMIKASAKTGITWYINPISNVINKEKPVNEEFYTNIELSTSEIRSKDAKFYVKLFGENWDDKRKQLRNFNGKILNNELSFIEGRFLAVNDENKKYFVVSYETTDKTNCTLTCLTFAHELVWQINQKQFDASDFFSDFIDINIGAIYENTLICNAGGFIYRIDIKNGNIIWKNRL